MAKLSRSEVKVQTGSSHGYVLVAEALISLQEWGLTMEAARGTGRAWGTHPPYQRWPQGSALVQVHAFLCTGAPVWVHTGTDSLYRETVKRC